MPAPMFRPFAETASVALVALLAVVGPLVIGGAPGWARLLLDGLAAIAAILWAISAPRSPRVLALPLLAAAVGVLQLVPLPDGLLVWLAPVSGGRWKVAHEGISGAWGSISVDPHATGIALRQLLFGAAVVSVVADLARDGRYRRWLLGSLAVSALTILGTGVAFPTNKTEAQGKGRMLLGFYDLAGPLDFWLNPTVEPVLTSAVGYPKWITVGDRRYEIEEWICGDGFGTYVDSNKFAGGVYLTLPVLCAGWLAVSRRWWPGIGGAIGRGAVAVALLAAGGWVTGRMANSRAGTAALVLAALVLAAGAIESRWGRRIAAACAACAAAALLVGLLLLHGPLRGWEQRLPAPYAQKMSKMLDDGRAEAARGANRMFRASPLFGTGLGSYQGLFQRILPDAHNDFAFAHDDVDQWLAETGLLGTVALVALLGALGVAWYRWRRDTGPDRWGESAGVWAALAGLAAHSFFDWNLHLPGNAFLAAVLIGLGLAAGRTVGVPVGAGRGGAVSSKAGWLGRVLAVAVCLACVAGVWLVWRDVRSQEVTRRLRESLVAVRRAESAKPPGSLPEETLRAALAAGEVRLPADPTNPDLPLVMGQVALHLAAAGDATAGEKAEELFRRTRRLSAVAQGLAEPLPPDAPRPGR